MQTKHYDLKLFCQPCIVCITNYARKGLLGKADNSQQSEHRDAQQHVLQLQHIAITATVQLQKL